MARESHPELLAALEEGILALADSEQWRRHLELQSRFHTYSTGNVLLIGRQCPGATLVAGYRAWSRLGRQVRRGERALWIFAPVLRRLSDGEEQRLAGFRLVPVFDLSQTEGEPLPVVCSPLAGGGDGVALRQLSSLAASIGFEVAWCELDDGVHGDCHHGDRRIRLEVRNAAAQQLKSLAHELAHARLHERVHSRPLAELEAESVAFVVCRALGLDSGSYSFGYVASWAGGGEAAVAAIRAATGRIQATATWMLETLGGAIGDGGARRATTPDRPGVVAVSR